MTCAPASASACLPPSQVRRCCLQPAHAHLIFFSGTAFGASKAIPTKNSSKDLCEKDVGWERACGEAARAVGSMRGACACGNSCRYVPSVPTYMTPSLFVSISVKMRFKKRLLWSGFCPSAAWNSLRKKRRCELELWWAAVGGMPPRPVPRRCRLEKE